MVQLDFAGGRQAADEVVLLPTELRPTGVYCANDMTAIGMLQGLMRHGIRVPDDIAIVGYDDIDICPFQAVPLATVRQPFGDVGSAVVDLLFQVMGGGPAASLTLTCTV